MSSRSRISSIPLSFKVAVLFYLSAANGLAITVPTVLVGNTGNASDSVVAYNGTVPSDTTTGLGSVNYSYSIGKYEVTAGEYTAFLNSVAATDTHALYVGNMSNTAYSGISRAGLPGSYSYSVADPLRPASFVSYWSAVRFTNWLSNGQVSGPQGPGTTETGSYTLTPVGIAANTVTRNASATWILPTENEWYKAAYYNAVGTTYYAYPTQSNAIPGNSLPDLFGNNANLALSGPYPAPIVTGHYTTQVGQFSNSAGPYGTFDQGGNVYEWNEALTPLSSGVGLGRGIRGGSFGDDSASSADRTLLLGVSPSYLSAVSGFRVAVVPEPASIGLMAFGATFLAWRIRNNRRSAARIVSSLDNALR